MSKGSVFLHKDGRWEARLSLGVINGKRQSRSFYGRTKEDAEQKMFAASFTMAQPVLTEMSVKELCYEWLLVMKNRIKISTAANYKMKIEKHIVPAFGRSNVNEITSRIVQAFIETKLKSGLSPRYVTDIIVLLKTIFKYANKVYYVSNPFGSIIMPKCTKPEVAVLTPEQQNMLKSYISHNISATTLGIAFALLMRLRLGEVCGLRWSDIDFEKRLLSVKRTVQRVSVHNDNKKNGACRDAA